MKHLVPDPVFVSSAEAEGQTSLCFFHLTEMLAQIQTGMKNSFLLKALFIISASILRASRKTWTEGLCALHHRLHLCVASF